MREIESKGDELSKMLHTPEAAHVLELSGARRVWFRTRTTGNIDGVDFQFIASASNPKDSLQASFVLEMSERLAEALKAAGPEAWKKHFETHFDDLLKAFNKAIGQMGYWNVQIEFSATFRISLSSNYGNEPASALEKMREDMPKIRALFGEMEDEALRRLRKEETENGHKK